MRVIKPESTDQEFKAGIYILLPESGIDLELIRAYTDPDFMVSIVGFSIGDIKNTHLELAMDYKDEGCINE